MKVFITSAYGYHKTDNFAVEWLKESALEDPFKVHEVVDKVEAADIVLFAEHHPPLDPYFFKVLKNPLFKKYKDKVVLYTDTDTPVIILPTITPSVEKKFFNPYLSQSAHYIARHCENETVKFSKASNTRKYLFSFIGASRTNPIRSEILQLNYPDCFLKDTSDKNLWELTLEEKTKFESDYVEVSMESYFVLCPRGIGVNSYRLYETMQMGLCPVIISDEWVPSKGPVWEDFSIIIKEKDIPKIPEILLKRKGEAINMGLKARENWEQWFSQKVSFHHLVCFAEKLLSEKPKKAQAFFYSYSQFLRPFHFRNLLRYYKNVLINAKKA